MPMQLPAGATTWVIEGQTGCEGCKGREWMHPMKPAFVRMSLCAHNTTIATSCAQYKKKKIRAIIMMFGIFGGLRASA